MAGGTMQVKDFAPLLYAGLHTIFTEADDDELALNEWQDIFTEMESKSLYEVMLGLIGADLPSRKAELEAPRPTSLRLGRGIKFINTTFAQEMRISKELQMNDQYKRIVREIIPEMRRNFKILKEYQAAAFFNLAFAVRGYEPDGVALFSTAHPLIGGGTSSNRSATDAALSVTSLAAARATMENTLTESGKKTPIIPKTLVVTANQRQLAEELVYSPLKPGQFPGGTQPNDINYNYEKFDVKVWHYLDNQLTGNAWFLTGSKKSMKFIHFLREPLNDDYDVDKRVRAFNYLMFTMYSFGFRDWRGAYGSNAS